MHHRKSTRVRRSRFTNGSRKRERFSQTTNTRRQVTRCVGHEIALLPEFAGKLNTCSHLTECAEKPGDTSRTSPSARRNQDQTSLALHRVRGWTKERILHSSKCTRDTDSHCSECADTNLFSAEFSKRGRCDIPGYAALFLMD